MGWGTFVKAELYFSKMNFKTQHELEYEIEKEKDWLTRCRDKMLLLISGKTVIPEDYKDNPINWIINEFTETWENILEAQYNITRLDIWLDNFDKTEFDEP